MNPWARYFPWAVLTMATIYLIYAMVPPPEAPDRMNLYEFSKLPVQNDGRIKPIDTLARSTLLIINNTQDFKDGKTTQPAIRWLLDAMTSKGSEARGEKHRVFRIENDQLVQLFGLESRAGSWRYSLDELRPHMKEFWDEAVRVHEMDSKQWTAYERHVNELRQHLQMFVQLMQLQEPHSVPPITGSEEWRTLREAASDAHATGTPSPELKGMANLLYDYAANDTEQFNKDLVAYRQQVERDMPDVVHKADVEVFFNHFQPFMKCCYLYVVVLLLALGGLLGWSEPLNRAAFCLAVLTLVVHTFALGVRMYISGRPPVINLYSSAVFIGWGAVVLGLTLEVIYANGLGNIIAGVIGVLTMIVANHLALSGDTIEPMRAVLATNFWLATHVICITLGYTATFFAGFLGIAYVVGGVLTRWLNPQRARSLSQMIYGVLCFATFLSFTGTVLGGIWADQSWGRFWGWDPKENGALLIVLWNALVLHARWAGMIKQRGMALLVILGNVVTAWSWFGTNQLGVGLHAYGFNDTLANGLVIFWGTQLLCLFLGFVPLRSWRSFRPQARSATTPAAPPSIGLGPAHA
jgi:ABC-type transport system involved in cytochrome c biogenesis permease subunit